MTPMAKLGAGTLRRLARHSRALEEVEGQISRSLGLQHPFRLGLLDEAAAVYLTAEDRERLEPRAPPSRGTG